MGNSNTYDLKLENAMFGEFNIMTVQTLKPEPNGQRKDLSFNYIHTLFFPEANYIYK